MLMEASFLSSDPQNEITQSEVNKLKGRIENHQSIIRFLLGQNKGRALETSPISASSSKKVKKGKLMEQGPLTLNNWLVRPNQNSNARDQSFDSNRIPISNSMRLNNFKSALANQR